MPNAWARKRLTNGSSGTTNYPDITGCINGIRVEIESKRPGKTPRPGQYKMLRHFRDLGCIAFWTDDLEDAERKIAFWMAVLAGEEESLGDKDLYPPNRVRIKDLAA